MGKVDPDQIQLFDIVVKNYTLQSNVGNSLRFTNRTSPPKYNIDIETKTNIDRSKNNIRFGLRFDIRTEIEENQAPDYLEAFIYFFFHIKNLDELIESENTKTKMVKITDELWLTLANVCYSSSRGIILTKNQGTAFEDLILPLYDISKLMVTANS